MAHDPGPVADVTRQHYAERLWPGPGLWVFALALAATAGLVFFPLGRWPAVAGATVVATAIVVAILAWWSPQVRVVDVVRSSAATEAWLQAGRARIPLSALGDAAPLHRSDWSKALGPSLDARSYRCVRGWIGTGIRVEVVDLRDPVPYWLVSTRRPARLVAALDDARRPVG